MMSQMSWQLHVLRLNSCPEGQVVFVTSGQGGSATHRQISMSSLNSSSLPQSCGKQVQLHVKRLKFLKFPTALVALLTQASRDPGGHLQKQNSSIPKGQGCVDVGQSQVQLAWFRILGLSQVKVHTSGVGLGVGSGVDTAVVVVGVIMLAVAGSVSPTAIIPVGVDVIFAVVGVVALGVIVPLGRICSTVVQCVGKKLYISPIICNTITYFAIRLSGQFHVDDARKYTQVSVSVVQAGVTCTSFANYTA